MMNDSQGPRYLVFKQDTPERRHRYCGSIHAADRHLALMNARDVFVRRPACYSLWVVPASEVHSFQAQDLDHVRANAEPAGEAVTTTFLVFIKPANDVDYDHLGDLDASSLEHAWQEVRSNFDLEKAAVVWLVSADSLIRSDDEDQESWFGSASSKPYRQPSFYRTNTMMREILRRASDTEARSE